MVCGADLPVCTTWAALPEYRLKQNRTLETAGKMLFYKE